MSKRVTDILAAIADRRLLGRVARFDDESWTAWLAFLRALFGLPLDEAALKIFKECTGREAPPTEPAREAWLVCGRRSGKSFVLALVAVFLACFYDYRKHLAPGERGTVMVVASDRKQARVIMRYIRGMLRGVPALKAKIEREVNETIDLDNRITIEVNTCSIGSVRGYTIVAALCDEIAFWRTDDSAEPDAEVLASIRPGMATIPNAMLLCASSPYARKGALWQAWKKYHGRDGDVLVWHAPTRTMNPTVPESVIARAFEDDPISAAAEWGAAFRKDVDSFLAKEAVEACVSVGVHERSPLHANTYFAFVDPAGGSGTDSMTLAIGHKDKDGTVVVDTVRERKPPFSPEKVVDEFAALLKTYRVTKVTGDRYAGEFVREPFRTRGITYELSERTKSDIYLNALPLINSGKVDLLDHDKLIAQICSLERRTARGGKDSIDHPPGAHDDVADAALGALLLCERRKLFDYAAFADEPATWESSGGADYVRAVMARGFRSHPVW